MTFHSIRTAANGITMNRRKPEQPSTLWSVIAAVGVTLIVLAMAIAFGILGVMGI